MPNKKDYYTSEEFAALRKRQAESAAAEAARPAREAAAREQARQDHENNFSDIRTALEAVGIDPDRLRDWLR